MGNTPLPDFKHYIRLIGRGQRTGQTLSEAEAEHAMSLLISGQVSAEQKGAFLMLLRVREETPQELAGFVRAFEKVNRRGMNALAADLDMGCYAGKRRHLPWFFLAVLALAQSGKRIFLHGTQEPESTRLYLDKVLECTGFRTAKNLTEAQQDMDRLSFCYMDLQQINPALDAIIQLRSEFGLRSCANTLARMLNPSLAPATLQGVFHRHTDEKQRHTAALLGRENAHCFRGEGGEIEYNPERDVTMHRVVRGVQETMHIPPLLEKRVIKPRQLDPQDLVLLWENRKANHYGTQAVIGTLAIMLMQLSVGDWSSCLSQSREIWQNRSPIWPASQVIYSKNTTCHANSTTEYNH